MAIAMLKIRRPNGRLIFNMEIAIRRYDGLYIETGPRWWSELCCHKYNIIRLRRPILLPRHSGWHKQRCKTSMTSEISGKISRGFRRLSEVHNLRLHRPQTQFRRFGPRLSSTLLQHASSPLPWASVLWLVRCTLECHWNATGWPSVHWDTTGWPSEYLQDILEHHCKNLVETAPHWNATGETLFAAAYTETPPEGL